MNQYSQIRRGPARSIIIVLSAVIAILCTSGDIMAIDIVERNTGLNSLEVQAGYFIGRRAEFRDLYGNGLAFGVCYRRDVWSKVGLGIRLSWTQLSQEHGWIEDINAAAYEFKWWDISIAPTVTYRLMQRRSLGIWAGIGTGISLRKVTVVPVESETEFDDNQTAPYGIVLVGADIRLTRSAFFGVRVSYDRHFFGDPMEGDFCDTGGFGFGGSIGIGF